MPRTFDGTDDKVTCSLGNAGLATSVTLALIVKVSDDSTAGKDFAGNGTNGYSFRRRSGTIRLVGSGGAFAQATSLNIVIANGWCLVAAGKTGGTNTPRFHKYVYSTNTWTHENATGTLVDPTTGSGSFLIGSGVLGDFVAADIAVVGAWNTNLSDAQVEALAYSLPAWFAVQPKGLWLLDQSAVAQTVIDLTGCGANESSITGTAVGTSSVPVFSYGAQPRRRNAIVAAPPAGGTVESYEFLGGGYFPAWG